MVLVFLKGNGPNVLYVFPTYCEIYFNYSTIIILPIKGNCLFKKVGPPKIGQFVYEAKYFHTFTHSSWLLTRCLRHLKWKYSLYNYTTLYSYIYI